MRSVLTFFLMLSILLFFSFQLVVYRQHALEVVWLYSKKAVGLSTAQDLRVHGAICNSLGRSNCSIRIFQQLLQKNPGDEEALSNLAIGLTKANRSAEAQAYYKTYFSFGGRARDVAQWYAKNLVQLGSIDEALPWYYRLLSHNSAEVASLDGLLHALQLKGKTWEALSLWAQVSSECSKGRICKKWREWNNRIVDELRPTDLKNQRVAFGRAKFENSSLERVSTTEVSRSLAHEQGNHVIRLPSLDNRTFLLPVRSPVGLVMIPVSKDLEFSQVRVSDLNKWKLKWSHLDSEILSIEKLDVGPFRLKNVVAQACDDCKTSIGYSSLVNLSGHIDADQGVSFLVLSLVR